MKTMIAELESTAPYSQSAPVNTPKATGETGDAYEERVWRNRIHADDTGEVFIPPMAFKNCLGEVAKYLSESVPGKGKATYTKHFEAGMLVVEPVKLGINRDDIVGERLFLPSDGIRGSGKRVWKTYPVIPKWKGKLEIIVLDPVLLDKANKVEEYLRHAGQFIGVGRFRPRQNGYYGRFQVNKFTVMK